MVVPIFNPGETIARISNGVQRVIHTIKDRLIDMGKQIKDNMWKTKTLITTLKFIPIITLAGLAIGILKKPLEFLVMLFAGIVISIYWVSYTISTIPPFIWIPFLVWFMVTKVIFVIAYTVVVMVIFCIVCLIFLIIGIINWMSGNKLSILALCQNSPTSWYKTPNYHLANKFERSFFCKSPCMSGYYPDGLTGEFCNKVPKGQPSFCPQAEVMRLFSKEASPLERHVYEDFNPASHFFFNFMTPEQKEIVYKDYFLNRRAFLDTCTKKLSTYRPLALNICSNLDMIQRLNLNGVSQRDISRMKQVCQQGFCNSRNRHFFCGKFSPIKDEDNKSSALIKNLVIFLITAIVFMFILFYTFQLVQQL
jgi:hypothetical protein